MPGNTERRVRAHTIGRKKNGEKNTMRAFSLFPLCLPRLRPLFANSQLEARFRVGSLYGEAIALVSTELGKLINIIDSSR